MTVNLPPASVVAAAQRMKSYFPYRHVWIVHNPGQVPEWETYAKTTRRLLLKQARSGKTVFVLGNTPTASEATP